MGSHCGILPIRVCAPDLIREHRMTDRDQDAALKKKGTVAGIRRDQGYKRMIFEQLMPFRAFLVSTTSFAFCGNDL
jgi:hypothetical protein